MFKVNNKDTRTMSMTSFWCVFIVKLKHSSHLFLVFTVDFEQLEACWNWTINLYCSENCLKWTPIGSKQGVRFRRFPHYRGFPRNETKIKRNTSEAEHGSRSIPLTTNLISLLISKLFGLSVKAEKIIIF